MTTISLLIATYNNKDYLRNCLYSVSRQEKLPDEIIVAEDYPKCDSEVVIKEFVDQGLPIKYVRHKNNLGRTKNYRFLLETATSEYVMFLDGDDQLVDNYLFRDAKAVLRGGKYVMYSAGCVKKYSEDNQVVSAVSTLDKSLRGMEYFYNWITSKQTLPHSSTIFSRKIATSSGAYTINVLNTDIVSLRTILLYGDIFLSPKVVSQWNYHKTNASCQFDVEESVDNLKMFTIPYKVAVSMGKGSFRLRRWLVVSIFRYILTISHAMFPRIGRILEFIFKCIKYGLK